MIYCTKCFNMTEVRGNSHMKIFQNQKRQCLSGMDFSRKGSVDEPIVEVVHFINQQPNYFTTSSCSGRISIYEEDMKGQVKKKGCKWLYITHDVCDTGQAMEAIKRSTAAAFFKFEPFVLHVNCHSLTDAQRMHVEASASGFRNSGITIGKKGKITLAVRSTHSLEAPLTHDGKALVTEEYVEHLVNLANMKMEENQQRIHRFFENLRAAIQPTPDRDLSQDTLSKKITQISDSLDTRNTKQRTTNNVPKPVKLKDITSSKNGLDNNEHCTEWEHDGFMSMFYEVTL